jgi:hypothetical protein
MEKTKSISQRLQDLLKELDSIEVVMLAERIEKIFEMTANDIKENPENWAKFNIISIHKYLELNEKIKKHLFYDNN